MLYRIGPLLCDTFPFEVGGWDRDHSGDFAKHPLIAAPLGYEAVGRGEDSLDIRGQLLPFHIGGLSEVGLAHRMVDAQEAVFVMRGDGGFADWYVLTNVKESHKEIGPGGVGFVVTYALKLERTGRPAQSVGAGLMATLSSIFG